MTIQANDDAVTVNNTDIATKIDELENVLTDGEEVDATWLRERFASLENELKKSTNPELVKSTLARMEALPELLEQKVTTMMEKFLTRLEKLEVAMVKKSESTQRPSSDQKENDGEGNPAEKTNPALKTTVDKPRKFRML